MCPQGEPYNQKKAEELAKEEHLIFICGHYEGYDERIRENLVTDEISIGDYVLTGGEIGAMAVIDSVVRLLPDVLGNASSAPEDSFSTGLLEHPIIPGQPISEACRCLRSSLRVIMAKSRLGAGSNRCTGQLREDPISLSTQNLPIKSGN